MNFRKFLLDFCFVCFVAVILPVSVSAQPLHDVDVSQALANNPQQFAKAEALLDKVAARGGHLPVIVELNLSFVPEGKMSGVQAVNNQRSGIAQAQNNVVGALQGMSVENIKRFETIPYMGLRVDQNALRGLINSPWVKNIDEDRPEKPSLDLSVPWVGGLQAWNAGYNGAGWSVAVLDTGVDKTHSFLTGKVVSEACYSTDATDTDYISTSVCPGGNNSSTAPGSGANCDASIDGCDHGTHVAGIATGSGTGFSGVAKGQVS